MVVNHFKVYGLRTILIIFILATTALHLNRSAKCGIKVTTFKIL